MERSSAPPKPPRLTAEEENALVSQVLEIIGGITLEALHTLDQPKETDVYLMEEGDDSVFYSDEDPTHQDGELANMSYQFDANNDKHLAKSEGVEESVAQKKSNPETEVLNDKEDLVMETDTGLQLILTEEVECKKIQTQDTERMHQSGSIDPGAEGEGESLQTKCTDAQTRTQTEPSVSSATATLQVREELVREAQTSNLEPTDVTNEESHARLSREEEVPKEMLSAGLHISADGPIKSEQQPERNCDVHFPVGFHQGPSPGYATLPLPKKSSDSATGQQTSFDHLSSSSKYSTLSYRKIRRGNTRKKIEEFEYMIMNL